MTKVSNYHDIFFREMFSSRNFTADFLYQYLPVDVLAQIDLQGLQIVKESFTDNDLDTHLSDLLYTVPCGKTSLYLYFLFEHKSSPDAYSGLQILRYMVKIWEQYKKQQKSGQDTKKKLPPIMPILFYHGSRPWNVPVDFHDLIDSSSDALKKYLPCFQYELYDISHLPDDEIKGEATVRAAMLLFKYIFDPDLWERLPEILSFYQEIIGQETAIDILETCLRYAVQATGRLGEDDIRKVIANTLNEEDIMQTFIDKYIDQGRKKGRNEGWKVGKQEGREEGKQEGREEGKQEGGALLLTGQLKKRFGSLPDWVDKKMKKADSKTLETWGLNLLSANKLEDVFSVDH